MMSEVAFQKHVYGRQVKHTLQSWPPLIHDHLSTMELRLSKWKFHEKVSVLLDKDARVWNESNVFDEEHAVPVTDTHFPSQK